MHFPPVAWPVDSLFPFENDQTCDDVLTCGAPWKAYTQRGHGINDPRTQDPSNGGTSPQNYVNVSSSCADGHLPSVWWEYDSSGSVLFFRWRVEQIANGYATGPSAGAFASTDPWKSAQWTVMIDINGDGFRDFAVHIDGSSGSPSVPIDVLSAIYSTLPNQSLDYINDPNVHRIAHNPTAFVDQATNRILNFQNALDPTASWPNGGAETVWDYGTTRSRNVSTSSCIEYIIDYQIPLGFLDASGAGGPTITPNTPIALFFTTANSLQNPLQKDAVFDGDLIGAAEKPAPFGDFITLAGETIDQPIVQSVAAAGCGPVSLTARVMDALRTVNGQVTYSLSSVEFLYYHDLNGDGVANDGSTWNFAASGSAATSPIGTWTATWNTAALTRGQYLIGVQATDDATLNASGRANRTFSYLDASQVGTICSGGDPHAPSVCPQPSEESWYGNPAPDPGVVRTTFSNTCGAPPPSVTKTAAPGEVAVGDPVQFTITINNTSNADLTVTQVQDVLPGGVTYSADGGGTCAFVSGPSPGDAALTWSFAPLTLAAASSCTVIFTADTSAATQGSYTNTAAASTAQFGSLVSDPASFDIGAPRLTIAKSASVASAQPGAAITYTITYSNDATVTATNVSVADTLPAGLTFVPGSLVASAATCNEALGTITCDAGNIAPGDGPFSITFQATVDDPYPQVAPVFAVNQATIDSDQTAPATADAATFIDAPRPVLALQKTADKALLDPAAASPGNEAAYTLSYRNVGNSTATAAVVTDNIPAGFCFVSASAACSSSTACPTTGGTITCNIGDLPATGTGSLSYTLRASTPYTGNNPATNSATITAANAAPASDSVGIGIIGASVTCETFYFKAETANVGVAGTRRIAAAGAPVPADAGESVLVTTPLGSAFIEALRFYEAPAHATLETVSSTIDTNFWIDRSPGPGITIQGTVRTYNDSTGEGAILGQGTQSFGGSQTGLFTFSVPATGATLNAGDRLLWIFEVRSNNTNQQADLLFQFDGTVPNSVSGSGSTFADSRSSVCFSAGAVQPLVSKQVDTLSTQPGGLLQYTIRFGNSGNTNATGARIVDTLPTGTTFVSAILNGVAATPTGACPGNPTAGQCTFDVQSTDTATAGQITSGKAGTLVINVSVDQPLAAGILDLTNIAQIETNEEDPNSDTARTTVTRPSVTVSKAASDTLLIPGDVVTYTLTVLNSGSGTATGVTVTDTIPATAYFTYVGASITGGTSRSDAANPTLEWTVDSLAPGASAVLTYEVLVGPGAAPAGVTTLENTAAVGDDQTAGTSNSNTVTVTISTNPNLQISKSSADSNGAPLVPGDEIEYTIVVTNTGSGIAEDTVIRDPIPSGTVFVPGSIACSVGSPQFDGGQNRAECALGSLAGGASATMVFRVAVGEPLPSTSETITNVAQVSASNAAAKQAAAVDTAEAAPVLTLTKTAPSLVRFPAARLASDAAAATAITVDDAAGLLVGDVISLNGALATVASIDGVEVGLDVPVSGLAGDALLPTWEYVIRYANEGSTAATQMTVTDTLPAGLDCIASDPLGLCPGPITIGPSTLQAGESGTIRLRVRPNAAGTFTNTASIDSAETPLTSDTAATTAGGIEVTKSTSSPLVVQSPAGAQAAYEITLTNTLVTAANDVTVTDLLPAGFTYAGPATFDPPGGCDGTTVPALGDEAPVWASCTIAGGGTLTISFVADVAPVVGPSIYQNEVEVAAPGFAVLPFDTLAVTEDDVEVLLNAVTGVVFEDINLDGVQNPGEPGIAGVIVRLVDPATGVDVRPPVTTDANGTYVFNNVPVGDYTVVESDPAGYVSTNANLFAVTVAPGGVASADFGDVPVPPGQGAIGGVVFEDLDGDGVQDPGEAGLAGVTITVDDGVNPPITKQTAADGSYFFNGLTAPQTYQVSASNAPATHAPTTADSENVALAANASETVSFGYRQANTSTPTLSHTPTLTPTPTATPTSVAGAPACAPVLKKVYAGAPEPGSQITYTLTAVNPCTETFSVTVTDPIPSGLDLVSVSAQGGAISSSGNTVTWVIAMLTKSPGLNATIVARIQPDVSPDTVIQNQAQLRDQFNRVTTAEESMRVRGGTETRGNLLCAIRGHVHARPGGLITYVARYKYGTERNALTLALPASDIEILGVFPAPSSMAGNVLSWQSLANTSGKVKVETRVSPAAADQTRLSSSATVVDGLGNAAVCDHRSVVRTNDRLWVALKGQTKTRPGRTMTLVARYSNALPTNEMTMVLPEELLIFTSSPPADRSGQTLRWTNLRSPSGLVKVKAGVTGTVVEGGRFTTSVTLSDATGQAVTSSHSAVVSLSGSTAPTAATSLTVTGQKSASPGSFITYTVRYSDLQDGDELDLDLPQGVTVTAVSPAAGGNEGGVLTWIGLKGPSGSVKVNLQVGSAAGGTTLIATAALRGAAGVVATASARTLVSGGSTESAGSASLTLSAPRTVTGGLTADISVSYRDLAGTATVTLSLPPELTPVLTIPAGSIGAGGQVTWSAVPGPTGSMKVRVAVDPRAASGSTLTLSSELTAQAGGTVTSVANTSVR